MKIDIKHLVYTLFLLFIPFSDARVMANAEAAILLEQQPLNGLNEQVATKKPGLFQRVKAIRQVQKQLAATAPKEPASKLARTSLLVFFGSYTLASLAIIAPGLIWLFIIGFITGMVLAAIVLFTEKNPSSRKIAKTVLISGAVMVLLVAVLTAVLLHYFPNTG